MFRLYTKQTSTFPFEDYAFLLNAVKDCKSVLEFGPGYSTYALIEAGCERIVSCENSPEWRAVKADEFKGFPQVQIIEFKNVAPKAQIDCEGPFDIAFVDGPTGVTVPFNGRIRERLPGQEECSRLNTALAALDYAPVIYIHDAHWPNTRATLGRLSGMGHKVETAFPFARIDRCAT